MFVSHCLLNQNVRYLGGACHPGAVDHLVEEWRRQGLGICQLPCPEQHAWGGVLKPLIAPAYGASAGRLWPFRSLLLRLFGAFTRARYRSLARRVSAEVLDYRRSGYAVAGIVGVAGSPSCGVRTTLDSVRWLEVVGRYREADLDPARLNSEAIEANAIPGQGWFIRALDRRLRRSGVEVRYLEHEPAAALLAAGRPRSGPK